MSAEAISRRMPRPRKVSSFHLSEKSDSVQVSIPLLTVTPYSTSFSLSSHSLQITLGIILGMAFTNSVLLVVTLVRPVPQFSSSGTLMTISARGNATLGKRGLAGSPDEDESADEIISTITPSPWKPERRKVRNEDEEGWYIADEESNETSMNNEEENPATTSENSKTSDSEDFYFPESTSSSARNSRATNEHSMSTLPPKQTMTVPKKKQDKIVKVKSRPFNDGWVELWIGPLGVCIQRG